MINRERALEMLGFFLGSLILFTWGLQHQEVISFDSRFYLFAEEMWRQGLSFFPTTYLKPYPDYPATSTVLIVLFAKAWGGLNKLIAVLPTSIAAAMTVALTYSIAALQQKRWGIAAVFFMLLTFTFLKSARAIALDMYPTLFTTACFYLIYLADCKQEMPRWYWIYFLLFLGFLFRGPIGLVLPTGVMITYFLLKGEVRRAVLVGIYALFLLIICMALLLAIAYHVGGVSFLRAVLRMEIVGRMGGHAVPRSFYFITSLSSYALSFPLACLVALGVCYRLLMAKPYSNAMQLLVKLIGWVLIILVGMSLPGDKKIRYVLPMLPAIALLAAYPFVAPREEYYFAWLLKMIERCLLFFPILLLFFIGIYTYYANHHALLPSLSYATLIGGLLFLEASLLTFRYCLVLPRFAMTALLLATLSFVLIYLQFVEPLELYRERARNFVQRVEVLRLQQQARLVFYQENPDGLPIKYRINSDDVQQPLFLADKTALQHFTAPAFFVTRAAYFATLPAASFKVLARDDLGHVNVVVFTR